MPNANNVSMELLDITRLQSRYLTLHLEHCHDSDRMVAWYAASTASFWDAAAKPQPKVDSFSDG